VLREVLFEEDPGATDIRTGDLSGLGTWAKFLRMATQESGGFLEVERLHGGIPAGGTSTAFAGGSHHADTPVATRVEGYRIVRNSEPIGAQYSEDGDQQGSIEDQPERWAAPTLYDGMP